MIARYIYSFIFLVVCSICAKSQAPITSTIISPKSLTIHVVNTSSVLIVHHVLPKQTLYSIAKFYGSNVDDLYELNEDLEQSSIHPGDKLVVKIPKNYIKQLIPDSSNNHHIIKMIYRVQSKETLYGIAKRSFKTTIQYLININNLKNNELEPGDYLTIGWINSNGISPIDQAINRVEEISAILSDSSMISSIDDINRKTNIQNIAYWHKNQENTSGLYVLHRIAKVNSWIEVKNPMFGTKVMAKVIGSLPMNTYPDDIDLIVSAKVANQLGVIDARFYVVVNYIAKIK